MTSERIEALLTQDGWPFSKVAENTWASAFRSTEHQFKFYVRLTEHWLYLTIVPYVMVPTDAVRASKLYERLLTLNRSVTLAKFALEQREVVLTVELPTEALAPTQFKDGLDALSFYANTHFTELSKLANS